MLPEGFDLVTIVTGALDGLLDAPTVLYYGGLGLAVYVAYHALRVLWTLVTLLVGDAVDRYRYSKGSV